MEKKMTIEEQLKFFEGVAAAALVGFKVRMTDPEVEQPSPAEIRDEYMRDPLIQDTVRTLTSVLAMMLGGEMRVVVMTPPTPPMTGKN